MKCLFVWVYWTELAEEKYFRNVDHVDCKNSVNFPARLSGFNDVLQCSLHLFICQFLCSKVSVLCSEYAYSNMFHWWWICFFVTVAFVQLWRWWCEKFNYYTPYCNYALENICTCLKEKKMESGNFCEKKKFNDFYLDVIADYPRCIEFTVSLAILLLLFHMPSCQVCVCVCIHVWYLLFNINLFINWVPLMEPLLRALTIFIKWFINTCKWVSSF